MAEKTYRGEGRWSLTHDDDTGQVRFSGESPADGGPPVTLTLVSGEGVRG